VQIADMIESKVLIGDANENLVSSSDLLHPCCTRACPNVLNGLSDRCRETHHWPFEIATSLIHDGIRTEDGHFHIELKEGGSPLQQWLEVHCSKKS
jgi:hypothetical protein